MPSIRVPRAWEIPERLATPERVYTHPRAFLRAAGRSSLAIGIVRIGFTNTVTPAEYGCTSNVDPAVPHPRWSQATERLIGTDLRVVNRPYDGYAQQVSHLYG